MRARILIYLAILFADAVCVRTRSWAVGIGCATYLLVVLPAIPGARLMEPTRWTRKPRVTKFGKGGWRVHLYGIGYTHPITGHGFYCDWRNARHLPRMRREVNDRTRMLVQRNAR